MKTARVARYWSHTREPGTIQKMRLGISVRLFFATLVISVLTVLLVSGAARWNFEREFLGYLNELAVERMDTVLPRLTDAYVEHKSWEFLGEPTRAVWYKVLRPGPGEALPPGGMEAALPPDLTGALSRLGLLDKQMKWVAGYRNIDLTMQHRQVIAAGQPVGWLVLAPFQNVTDGGDQRFALGQLRANLAIGAAAVLMAALLAWWTSHRLLGPVKQIARATHQLINGQHDVRVAVANRDEVGQLGLDFNRLADTLQRNEELRRSYMAEVSHELRTPLAILRGELEALEDGVRPLNAEAVASLQAEIKHLGKIVEDLYELALSDIGALSYRMEPIDVRDLLQRVASAHKPVMQTAGLDLQLTLPNHPIMLNADEGRLQQLLENLLENCRRYTDSPGQVQLSLTAADAFVQLDLQDSAPGLSPEHLPRLFERFFRVEDSRNRASGGAGLGLAIARNIVAAHGGTISASHSPLGGVWIQVKLPCQGMGL